MTCFTFEKDYHGGEGGKEHLSFSVINVCEVRTIGGREASLEEVITILLVRDDTNLVVVKVESCVER